MLFVLPRVGAAPVIAEVVLHHTHLLLHSLLGIFLHTAVYGGVNLQSVGVEVVARFFAPRLQFLGNSLTEIKRLTIVGTLNAIVEVYVDLRQRIVFLLGDVLQPQHIAQHHISALQTALGVEPRVVGRRSLQQAHQHCTLLDGEVFWRGVEVGFSCRLYAVAVATEIHCIGIHRKNLLFRIEHFNLHRKKHLLAFHYYDFQSRHLAKQTCAIVGAHPEHVLHQLLGDGAGAACMTANHILESGSKTLKVDAMMLIESLVLGVDEHLEEDGINILVAYRRTVLVEILANEFAVGAI